MVMCVYHSTTQREAKQYKRAVLWHVVRDPKACELVVSGAGKAATALTATAAQPHSDT